MLTGNKQLKFRDPPLAPPLPPLRLPRRHSPWWREFLVLFPQLAGPVRALAHLPSSEEDGEPSVKEEEG
jgi:hypothetical protein